MAGDFQVELYARIQAPFLTEAFLDQLERVWSDVGAELSGGGLGEMARLSHLEVSLLSDDDMASVHGQFLDDPTPTDVITFDHGELLIGVETAKRQAEEFQTSPAREIALYGIHGMLHLSGFDDKEPRDSEIMDKRQFELLAQFFPEL